jgi:hypothetical protein
MFWSSSTSAMVRANDVSLGVPEGGVTRTGDKPLFGGRIVPPAAARAKRAFLAVSGA